MFRVRDAQLSVLARQTKTRNVAALLNSLAYTATSAEKSSEIFSTDRLGNMSRFKVDDHGHVSEYTTPLASKYRFEYDPNSRLAAIVEPSGLRTTLQHEEGGFVKTLSRGSEQVWSFEWDHWGNLEKVVSPDNRFSQITSIGPGKCTAFRNRLGHIARFERDEFGALRALVDPNGNRTSFVYEEWDRPSRIIRADTSYEDIVRDSKGRVKSASVNGAPWAQVEQDDRGRLKEIRYADDHFVCFKYNEAGNVVEARNPSIAITRQYDTENRLVQEDQGGQIVKYEYDAGGLLRTLTTPTGECLKFAYDADGRLSRAVDWKGGVHTFDYETSGRVIIHHLPNTLVTRTQLTELGLPSEIRTVTNASARQPFALKFERDENSRVTALKDSEAGVREFSYDPEGNLLSVRSPSGRMNERFSYDQNGNRINANDQDAQFDSLNQMRRHGVAQMAYDARGNLFERSTPDGITRYTYNGQNLLTAVVLPDGRRVRFTYDAFARRISKTVESITTRYVWAGDQLLCEFKEGGAQPERRDYLFVPDSYTPLSMRVNGRIYQYHVDHRGAPRWLTDESRETVWSAEYSAFGQSYPVAEKIRQPLRFAGQYFDEETALHYNRARYYDPSLGRYLSRDPLDIAAGLNLYIFAGNDPINAADPLGLFWKALLAGAAIVAGVALIVIAAPVVAAAVVAVATGAAIAAGTVGAAAAVVGGAALVGAGIGLALTAEDASPGCQALSALRGAAAGAGAALAVMGAAFSAAGLAAACGGGLLAAGAGGGQLVISSTAANAVGAGLAAAVAGTMMMTAAGQGGGGGGGGKNQQGKQFNQKQREIVEEAKLAKKKGGIPEADAKALVQKAKDAGLPARGPEAHPGRPFGKDPHIHVGPVNHIPVK